MVDQPTLDRIIEFHGHLCAGLALGIRAAEVALEEIGAHSADEEVVASSRPTCAAWTPSSS